MTHSLKVCSTVLFVKDMSGLLCEYLIKVGGIVPAETLQSWVGTSGCFQSLLALSESPTGLSIMTYDHWHPTRRFPPQNCRLLPIFPLCGT